MKLILLICLVLYVSVSQEETLVESAILKLYEMVNTLNIKIAENNNKITKDKNAKRIVCYYASWATYRPGNGKFNVEDIDPTKCTHIIYAYLGLNDDGSVNVLDSWFELQENKGNFKKFVDLKQKSPKTKFMISMGGWNEGTARYSKMANDDQLRETFAQSVFYFIQKHNFDGFDLDWEYPAQRGGSALDKENYVKLLKLLYSKLDPYGLFLSVSVVAEQSKASISYDIPNVCENVDFINLHTYDFHDPGSGKTGHNAPLYGKPDDELNVNASVQYWLSQGCQSNKINLGLAAYGRTLTLASANQEVGARASGLGPPGVYTREAGFLGYNEICEISKTDFGYKYQWDDLGKVPYMFKGSNWITYDNLTSINLKLQYLMDYDLGGASFWSMDTDDFKNVCGNGKFSLIYAAQSFLRPDFATTEAPTTTSTLASCFNGYNCIESGFFQDPCDCSKYYECSGGPLRSYTCLDNKYFDNYKKFCDDPATVICNPESNQAQQIFTK